MMAGSLRWDHYEVRVTTGAAGEVAPAARAALAVEPEAPVTGRGALSCGHGRRPACEGADGND